MAKIGEWENAEPGIRRKIHPPGKALMIMQVEFREGAESAEHAHPHEQISYCLRGEFEFRLDGRTVRLCAGESLIIPGGTRHAAKALVEGALLDSFAPVREDLVGN